jgi:hypothetical protein
MSHRGSVTFAALAAVLLAAVPARGLESDSLRLLLLGAEDMNTPQTLLRADVALRLETHTGERATDAIALFAPGKDARWYVQVREPAVEALVLGGERKVMQRIGRKTETLPIGAPIPGLPLNYEDLSRFKADDFKLWQITDENPDIVLAGGHPIVDSAYAYRAYTLDKKRTLATKVQLYAPTLTNMVKVRSDADHVLVGKKWLPGTITIQDFAENATATLTLRWTQNASAPPELLAAESFATAPPLPWADAATASPSPAATP